MDLAVWRDISLMWLILLSLFAVIPIGVLFFFAVKGMRRLRQLAKQYLPVVQDKARQVADKTEGVSQKVASPIIGARARMAQVNGLANEFLARRKKA